MEDQVEKFYHPIKQELKNNRSIVKIVETHLVKRLCQLIFEIATKNSVKKRVKKHPHED